MILFKALDGNAKDIGKHVFLEGLPIDSKAYFSYYPSVMPSQILENRFRNLGEITRRNLVLEMGRLKDAICSKMKSRFDECHVFLDYAVSILFIKLDEISKFLVYRKNVFLRCIFEVRRGSILL